MSYSLNLLYVSNMLPYITLFIPTKQSLSACFYVYFNDEFWINKCLVLMMVDKQIKSLLRMRLGNSN
ncbi:hypothetical protein PE36_15587 [Moritella sp. PE36]|nr:hypothetical protein PE36_15587 [Moritella sp. PE36]